MNEIYQVVEVLLRDYRGKRVAVWGAGEVGRVVAKALRQAGFPILGNFDDYVFQSLENLECILLRPSQWKSLAPEVIVLGTLKSRARMKSRLNALGYQGVILELPGEDDDPYAPRPVERRPEIEALRNRHRGQAAFVIGNGPSLKLTDPRTIRGAVTLASNNIFLLEGFRPDYYTITDLLLAQDRADVVNALSWNKLFPLDLKKWLHGSGYYHVRRVPELTGFSEDFALESPCNFTVSYTLLQLAYFLGCDPVYLIGFDHNYEVTSRQADVREGVLTSQADDPNHFHPDYFGKGYRWHIPRVDQMEVGYRLAKAAFEKAGRRIINATAGGKLEVFDREMFAMIGFANR